MTIFFLFYDQRMTGLLSGEFQGEIDLQSHFDDLDAFVDHYGGGTGAGTFSRSRNSIQILVQLRAAGWKPLEKSFQN